MHITFPDEAVRGSKVYRNVLADAKIQEDGSYLVYSSDSVISVVDEIDFIYTCLQAMEQDKGIRFEEAELDESPHMQEMVLAVAKLCNGPHAYDTFCQYLRDCELVECQLYIAINYPHFYTKVTDPANILPTVANHLSLMA